MVLPYSKYTWVRYLETVVKKKNKNTQQWPDSNPNTDHMLGFVQCSVNTTVSTNQKRRSTSANAAWRRRSAESGWIVLRLTGSVGSLGGSGHHPILSKDWFRFSSWSGSASGLDPLKLWSTTSAKTSRNQQVWHKLYWEKRTRMHWRSLVCGRVQHHASTTGKQHHSPGLRCLHNSLELNYCTC